MKDLLVSSNRTFLFWDSWIELPFLSETSSPLWCYWSSVHGLHCFDWSEILKLLQTQVAERALYVLNNEQFRKMAQEAMDEVFPVIVEGMEKNLKWHWSKSVRQLTQTVKVMLEEMEPCLYSKCVINLELRESAAQQEEIKRREKWERIERAADAATAAQNQFLQPPHCICVSNWRTKLNSLCWQLLLLIIHQKTMETDGFNKRKWRNRYWNAMIRHDLEEYFALAQGLL